MPFTDYSFFIENKPEIQQLELSDSNGVSVSMLRLDRIHAQVSGNKLFKLTKFLEEALFSEHKTVLTFGGAYSNHLVATAFACTKLGLRSIGIVRGELQSQMTHSLASCREFGMELVFIGRKEFSEISFKRNIDSFKGRFGEFTLIPAGGFGRKGAEGASEILDLIPKTIYSHICLPVGSATTVAGLLMKKRDENILAFPAIKNMHDIPRRLNELGVNGSKRLQIFNEYHFGGFAKRNDEIIKFMNRFYKCNRILLDFVYTGKMMFGVLDLIEKKYFPEGSHILCIHTGGLQGNLSLPGELIF